MEEGKTRLQTFAVALLLPHGARSHARANPKLPSLSVLSSWMRIGPCKEINLSGPTSRPVECFQKASQCFPRTLDLAFFISRAATKA
eukprot:760845-Hanusia_phi.AAC.4